MIADPIRQTLGPKGGNVLVENNFGVISLTNDGATIAKNIEVEDEFENSIIEIVKSASLQTNMVAGDGTSSTVVLSKVLVDEGLKLLESGVNPIYITKVLREFKDKYLDKIKKSIIKIKNSGELFDIARISANNDEIIAKDVVEIMQVIGEDGLAFIEQNNSGINTVLEKDLGFQIKSGLLYKELLVNPAQFHVNYTDIPVLITDKKLYYAQEAETILRTVKSAGYNSVVIVARDFMGESVSTFITNHQKGDIKVALIKDPQVSDTDNTSLEDLAIYLGGKVISERTGSIVNKLKIEDFVLANRVFSNAYKTLFTPKIFKNKKLKDRIQSLKNELKKDRDNLTLQKRISSLTSGVVTVKVGGSTPIEIGEKKYRYEDAINATKQAMLHGYLAGGGITLLKHFNKDMISDPEFLPLCNKFASIIVSQIAENCGEHVDTVVKTIKQNSSKSFGYNALNGKYEDLLNAGVIEPFKVVEMSIENSISIANIILSTNYYIVNDVKKDESKKQERGNKQ